MKNVLKALAAARRELGTSIHADADGQRSRYVSLEKTLSTIEPIAAKHGLLNLQFMAMKEEVPVLRMTIVHLETGEVAESTTLLIMDKPGPQGLGASETYARRRSLMTMYGLATDDDPDAAQQPKSKPAPYKAPTSQGPYTGPQGAVKAEEYVITWGQYKGARLGKATVQQLHEVLDYCTYLRGRSAEDKKDVGKHVLELESKTQDLLNAHTDFAVGAIKNDSEIPF